MNAAQAFVESTFAAARNKLHAARVAQINALQWGAKVYEAGSRGKNARQMVKYWHGRRALWLGEAMAERQRAKLLRLACAPTERPRLEVVR